MTRIWFRFSGAGITVNVSTAAGSADPTWLPAQDFIAPGMTNLYRIGCDLATADPGNLATNPTMEAPALAAMPGWGQAAYGDGEPLVTMKSDTAVAADGRHSAKITIPSAKPIVFPLAGVQMVKPPAVSTQTLRRCLSTWVYSDRSLVEAGRELGL